MVKVLGLALCHVSEINESADPCLALAPAGRRPGSPQVCGFGLLGPWPARSTRHQTLCHCLPRSPRTCCPAAAALCQRLPIRHNPFRGFQNEREARPITTQHPGVGLYRRFATAFPGHREHVALQRQPCASTWPVAIIHLEGFKTCVKHGPSGHKTPLWAFTALPLPSQVTVNTLPCSGAWPRHYTPFRGFPGPGVTKPARSPFTASAWPLPLCHCRLASRHTPFRGFRGWQNLREAPSIRTRPLCGLLPLCHCLPKSPRTRCPAEAALCQRLAMSPYSI